VNAPIEFLVYASLGVVVFTGFVILVYRQLYVSVGPDEILVVSGGVGEVVTEPSGQPVRRGYRLIRGGGTLINPILEKYGIISLGLIQAEVRESRAPVRDGKVAHIQVVANLRLRSDDASLPIVMEHYLSKSREEIANIAQRTVDSEVRAALAGLSADQLCGDRQSLATSLGTSVAQALDRIGMDLVTLAVPEARLAD
jgi:flotillin